MKTKKLKGGFTPYITADEKLLVTVSRNTAYVYDLESGKLQQSVNHSAIFQRQPFPRTKNFWL